MNGCSSGGWDKSSTPTEDTSKTVVEDTDNEEVVADTSKAFDIALIDDEVVGAGVSISSVDGITLMYHTDITDSNGTITFTDEEYSEIITALDDNNILDTDYIIIKSSGGSDTLGSIQGEMTALIKVSDFKLKNDLIVSPLTTLIEKLITRDNSITDNEIDTLLSNSGISDLNSDGVLDNKDLLLYNPTINDSKLENAAYDANFLNIIRDGIEQTDTILENALFQLNTTISWLDTVNLDINTAQSVDVNFIITANNLANVTINEEILNFTDNLDGNYTLVKTFSTDDYTSETNTETIIMTNSNGVELSHSFTVIVTETELPDTTAPALSSTTQTFTTTVGTPLTLENVTATDDTDGSVTVTQSGTVDFNTVGTYTVTYSATDTAGNSSSITHTYVVEAEADTTPDTFTFTDQTNVSISTLTESNTITISGINTSASISVSGGEYSIDGGSWSSGTGTVTNGQTVKVRHTTSGDYSTKTNTTLNIGGVTDIFSLTTEAEPADTTPDTFTFTDQTNVSISTLTESNTITISGINTSASISVSGWEYSINGGSWSSGTGTVTNGQTVKVRHTTSASYTTSTNTTLTIGGVSDVFTTTTQAAPNTAPVVSDVNLWTVGSTWQFNISASDADGDALTYSVTGYTWDITWASISWNTVDFTTTPWLDNTGTWTLSYKACDTSWACDTWLATLVAVDSINKATDFLDLVMNENTTQTVNSPVFAENVKIISVNNPTDITFNIDQWNDFTNKIVLTNFNSWSSGINKIIEFTVVDNFSNQKTISLDVTSNQVFPWF